MTMMMTLKRLLKMLMMMTDDYPHTACPLYFWHIGCHSPHDDDDEADGDDAPPPMMMMIILDIIIELEWMRKLTMMMEC